VALKRELAAAVAIPIVFAILFFAPPIAFDLVAAAIALAALWEFYRLAEKTGMPPAKTVGVIAGALASVGTPLLWNESFVGSVKFGAFSWEPPSAATCLLAGAIVTAILSSMAVLFSGVSPPASLGGAAATVFGVVLIVFPASSWSYLRGFSPKAVVFLFGVVWVCDSCAYYGGRSFGSVKLAPSVSPNKTWEGTISGFLGATAFGAAAGTWVLLPQLGPWRGALAGALASSAGQLGDLVESLWKRGAGVKDSGVFLPGHGGFYDRIDSLLFAGPVLAAFVAALPRPL
jgi:phosphatidate cytidylyltransferase